MSAGRKVKDLHPSILSALLRDPDKVAMTLVQLRELLPHANVSQLVARMPALLLKVTCWLACLADEQSIQTATLMEGKMSRIQPAKCSWPFV